MTANMPTPQHKYSREQQSLARGFHVVWRARLFVLWKWESNGPGPEKKEDGEKEREGSAGDIKPSR